VYSLSVLPIVLEMHKNGFRQKVPFWNPLVFLIQDQYLPSKTEKIDLRPISVAFFDLTENLGSEDEKSDFDKNYLFGILSFS
jgi:hypothetical protein